MKARLSLAIALLAGCAIGAAAENTIGPKAKPPAYTIAEIEVIDPEGFQAFAKRNAAGVAAAGGLFLALPQRGRILASEGTAPKAVAMIAWDSLDEAAEYFNSPTFKELIPIRDKAARVRLFHVEGLPR